MSNASGNRRGSEDNYNNSSDDAENEGDGNLSDNASKVRKMVKELRENVS
jgi:hypothetical protein